MKKLIDEKVLQRYYFECFMKATPNYRKSLLPKEFCDSYSKDEYIKGLIPEHTFTTEIESKIDHRADFVLCPNLKYNKDILNVEIKWNKKDFENQTKRFKFYNGELGKGYVVCLDIEKQNSYNYILYKDEPTNIPVVYLDTEKFKNWFIINSENIINQSLATKFNYKLIRPSGKKYWVIALSSNESYSNYKLHGRKNERIWAFKDSINAKNIIDIREDDYIIFARVENIRPYNRQIYPYSTNPEKEFGTGRKDRKTCKSSLIDWDIVLIDILKVHKGHHINTTYKSPYDVFEDNYNKSQATIYTKNYTQFIKLSYSSEDPYQYFYDDKKNIQLNRKLFPERNEHLLSFVELLRDSYNEKGDAREITSEAFLSVVRLLNNYK